MSQHSDRMYVGHMRDACGKVARHIAGLGWPEFQQDEKTQDAVIRALESIGEAGSNVSPGYRSLYPESPWRVIKDLRNALIHEYANVRIDLVWNIATKTSQT